MDMASALWSAGAEPQAWRRWSSLTSLGNYLVDQRLSCAYSAALAGEWELLARVDRAPISSNECASITFWELIGGEVPAEPHHQHHDPFDAAWHHLRQSIPQHRHGDTESALDTIADLWIQDSEGDWEDFRPGYHPNFEEPVNVVAALARHHGFTPTRLPSPQLRFLDAGLAPGQPDPLVPAVVSV